MIRRFRWERTVWRPGLVAGLAAVAMMAATMIGVTQTAEAAAGGSSLSAGQELQAGQDLVSPGGQYTLVMQTDGNLVTYGNGCVIWASNTGGTGSHNYLAMQSDGNLVVYTSAGKPVWASNTGGSGSQNSVDMQVDGNLVVYTSAGKPVWASGSSNADELCTSASMSAGKYLHSANGQYTLNMQGDGNLVVYHNGSPIWASNTGGTGSDNSVVMQTDGNLVVYTSAGKPVWASNTGGSGSQNRLVLNDEGNFVINNSAGKAIWTDLTIGQWATTTGPTNANKYYDYPYPNAPQCTAGADICTLDQWGFDEGQCVSWVAYRLNELNGITFKNNGVWHSASNWASAAERLGIKVNGTPALGSVAWYSSGHVAYVERVNSPTSVVISEMNYDYANGFRVRTITTSSGWPTDFIHIADR